MGRSPFSEKEHNNNGHWTEDEDQRLINYIIGHGEGRWRSLPKAAGLARSGESCRLRWINDLRPDLKRGNFTEQEDELLIKLHSLSCNSWSMIASWFPGRTVNQIKYHWNIGIKRKPNRRGIDPQTHRPLKAPTATATATATDRVAVVNNNNDGSNNNNNGKFQELKQNISCTQASSLNTEATRNSNAVKKEDAAAANSISESTSISRWEKGKLIGAGGFGTVYVARNRKTGDLCAVKELKNIENAESIKKEIEILCQLEHANIVKYLAHKTDKGGCISLYMELIEPGSLKKYIKDKGGALHEPLIRNFTAKILSGLVYLHSKRVVHRDLKPDNILVGSQDSVKLVDFGVSKHLAESVGNHSKLGTPYYAAPEVLKKKDYQNSREAYAADIWSLGCVIIEMFSGRHPWPGFEPVQAFYNVAIKEQRPPMPEKLCGEGKDFLDLCFISTPADRPSAAKLQNHPFVKPHLSC